jgi:hypothetical protein
MSDVFFLNMQAHHDAEIAANNWRPSWPLSIGSPETQRDVGWEPGIRRQPDQDPARRMRSVPKRFRSRPHVFAISVSANL